jgi:hypothetical protein
MKMSIKFIRWFFALLCVVRVIVAHDDAAVAHSREHEYAQIECVVIPVSSAFAEDKEAHSNENAQHISHPHIPGPRVRIPAGMTTSTNWGGYVAASKLSSPKKSSVSAAYGTWIVPTLEATLDDSYCAIWVGIDGYSSPTVEQIGTSHDFVDGQQDDYAWFEMYPGGAYIIDGFPLVPGDVISASVVYTSNSTFVLKLYNDTQQVFVTIPTQYTKSSTARRQSAEWIVEAPYYNGILPLSDFVTAYLWGCSATINGKTAPIKNSSWQNIGIEMITGNGTPKAIPSAILPDNGSFFVTWNHE